MGMGKRPSKEEAEAAVDEANTAANLAQEALNLANAATEEANIAAEDAEKEVEEAAEEPIADEAEAVGDPHMTLATGEKRDLCCEGSVCKSCPFPALLQHDEDVEAGGTG